MKKAPQIFIVEDDAPVNALITKFLEKQGYPKVRSFFSSEEMIPEIQAGKEIIIVQDYDLPGKNGLETIREIKPRYPKTEFIFLSGQRSIEVALEAIRGGAFDYIVKDIFAKENVATKLGLLLRLKKLERDRTAFKRIIFFFLALLVVSWITLVLHLFFHRG